MELNYCSDCGRKFNGHSLSGLCFNCENSAIDTFADHYDQGEDNYYDRY